MDMKDLRKLAAEYNSLELLQNPQTLIFLKALYNEAIEDCADSIMM